MGGSSAAPSREPGTRGPIGWLRRNAVGIYAALAVAYMLIPIAVIACSLSTTQAGTSTSRGGLHARLLEGPVRPVGPDRRDGHQPRARGAVHGDRDRDRDPYGAGAGAPALLRAPRGEPADRRPDGDAGGGDRRGAAVDVRLRRVRARVRDAARRPCHVLDQLRRHRRALASDRLRPQRRGRGGGPRRGPAGDLPDGHPAAVRARRWSRRRCSHSCSRSTTS